MKNSFLAMYAASARTYVSICALLLSLILVGCSGEGGESTQTQSNQGGSPSGLSAEQLEKGIGPIRSVELGPIDQPLAETGETIFTTKCSACHKLGERYVGPPLGEVLTRRTPEFVMNMMLNPAEMVEKHPEVKALLAQYLTPMPNQNLTRDDARAVLEYLRREQQGQEAGQAQSTES